MFDLHGNAKKKEVCPDGSKDENVFDIQQVVGIIITIKCSNKSSTKVYHTDLFEIRDFKYK